MIHQQEVEVRIDFQGPARVLDGFPVLPRQYMDKATNSVNKHGEWVGLECQPALFYRLLNSSQGSR